MCKVIKYFSRTKHVIDECFVKFEIENANEIDDENEDSKSSIIKSPHNRCQTLSMKRMRLHLATFISIFKTIELDITGHFAGTHSI